MTAEDYAEFARALTATAETLGVALSQERIEGYWHTLRDVPLGNLLRGLERAMRIAEGFPVPARLRDFAYGGAGTGGVPAPVGLPARMLEDQRRGEPGQDAVRGVLRSLSAVYKPAAPRQFGAEKLDSAILGNADRMEQRRMELMAQAREVLARERRGDYDTPGWNQKPVTRDEPGQEG